jgi:hypothetical protein
MAHTALAAAFVLNHTKIGKCTLKKFRIYSQWHRELFLIVIFLLSIGGAMNAPRLWNLRKEHLAGVRIFLSPVGNCFHKCQFKNMAALGYFPGLSCDEGRADFAKNLRASSFNEGLFSIDTNFS